MWGGKTDGAEISLIAGDNINISSAETGNTAIIYTISSTASGSGSDFDLPIYKGVDESGHTVSGAVVIGNSTNKSLGLYSLSEGGIAKVIGDEGESDTFIAYSTSAIGISSHAEGASTLAIGDYSHAEGYYTEAIGDYSHAEGSTTSAIGDYSHAEGSTTSAMGESSHAEGVSTLAQAYFSHAEGDRTLAQGYFSHTEGGTTSAMGLYSHAEGQDTMAIGASSHAEGVSTSAIGGYSHAEGLSTMTSNDYEASFGVCNLSTESPTISSSTLFSVGCGDIDTQTLKNALEIKRNGDIYFNAYVHPKDSQIMTYYKVDFNKVIQALIDAGTLVL